MQPHALLGRLAAHDLGEDNIPCDWRGVGLKVILQYVRDMGSGELGVCLCHRKKRRRQLPTYLGVVVHNAKVDHGLDKGRVALEAERATKHSLSLGDAVALRVRRGVAVRVALKIKLFNLDLANALRQKVGRVDGDVL